ncbi:hypothetical protein [Pacificispira sp.]|uniref:hypothetical protein n=1 Tax=Pacificispira sp. TaxID=2888761 RepID=UPI003B52423C
MTDADQYERIGSALDRFQEAHFWIHNMEQCYHRADQIRWFLNVFLKALDEVPQLVSMSLQNANGFAPWFREQKELLKADPLISTLSKTRDFVVHQNMLLPSSAGSVGITELRGMKLGLQLPIHPLEDSQDALIRTARVMKEHEDILGLITPDEDSLPAVHREWQLDDFDEELVDLCARAWLRMGQTLTEVMRWQGVEPLPLSLDCRHGRGDYRMFMMSREKLMELI